MGQHFRQALRTNSDLQGLDDVHYFGNTNAEKTLWAGAGEAERKRVAMAAKSLRGVRAGGLKQRLGRQTLKAMLALWVSNLCPEGPPHFTWPWALKLLAGPSC